MPQVEHGARAATTQLGSMITDSRDPSSLSGLRTRESAITALDGSAGIGNVPHRRAGAKR